MTTKVLDPIVLRQVAGAFATGITVVSTHLDDGEIYGMTANSFLSVSLEPPLVSISVQNTGALMKHLQVGRAMGISILHEGQEDISNHFAGRKIEGQEVAFTQKGSTPVVSEAMAWYNTTVHQVIPAGDHHLVLCEVHDCDRDHDKQPLLYYNGYQRLGAK